MIRSKGSTLFECIQFFEEIGLGEFNYPLNYLRCICGKFIAEDCTPLRLVVEQILQTPVSIKKKDNNNNKKEKIASKISYTPNRDSVLIF